MRSLTILGVLALCTSLFAADVVLQADDNDGHDAGWAARYDAGVNSWGLKGHSDGTVESGDIWFNSFPGQTGNYIVTFKIVIEDDGDPLYSISAGGRTLKEGSFPWAGGCEKTTRTGEIDCGIHTINNGEKINIWGSSIYHCEDNGTYHGAYCRWYQIEFTATDSTPPADTTPAGAPWYEKDGYCLIECESGGSPGNWVLHTDNSTHDFVDGFMGEGCLQFTGNQEASGGVQDPIEYPVVISSPGTYYLYMRGLEAPMETGEGDKANDCYVKMENQGDSSDQSGCEGNFTKFVLLGGSYQWSWQVKLECGHHTFFHPVVYHLDAGTHNLSIAGRSKNFFVDRMVLTKVKGGYDLAGLQECRTTDCAGTYDPGATPTAIVSPAAGATLTMGQTVTLEAEGKNVQWSYDANSDGLGAVAIDTGLTVQFQVPTGITGPKQITITASGYNGSVSRTYDLADGSGSAVLGGGAVRASSLSMATSGLILTVTAATPLRSVAVYRTDGVRVARGIGSAEKQFTLPLPAAGVYVVRSLFENGSPDVRRLIVQ